MTSFIRSLLFLSMLMSASLFAQTPAVRLAPTTTAPEKKEEPKKPEKPDRWLYVKNVDIYPVSGPMLRRAGILVKNDKIEAMGEELEVPKEATTIDGDGLRAYPGLIHVNGGGLLSSSRGPAKDGVDPFGLKSILGLAHGITTVVNGQSAVKLVYGTVDDAGLRDNLFIGMFYSSRNPRGKMQLRADLKKARDYIKELAEFEAKKKGGEADAKAPDEKSLGNAAQYLPLLQKKTVAAFNVDEMHDLLDVCEIVGEFGFKAIVRGATEGWTCADTLGRAGISAIVIPRTRVDAKDITNRPHGSSIENAAILHKSGVPVVCTTANAAIEIDGMAGGDVLSLPFEAGFAVRGGLPGDVGLASVTLNAARMFGLEDRVGSLEPGKDADIIIADGDILHYATMVQYAIVNGVVAYDKSKESLFGKIRPRDTAKLDEKQWWPRRFGEMPDEWTFVPETKKPESQPTTTTTSQPESAPASAPTTAPAAPDAPAEGTPKKD